MMLRILLLLFLTSSVCAGTFQVNVTQSFYQAEENQDVILEWRFTTKTDSPSNSLYILCYLFTGLKPSVLYHVREGVEVPESQDEEFSGRVQSDIDVLREGRLILHVSRIRTNESGLYLCDIKANEDLSSEQWRFNVIVAAQRPTDRPEPEPESPGWIGLYGGLGLGLAVGLVAAALLCKLCHTCRVTVNFYSPL